MSALDRLRFDSSLSRLSTRQKWLVACLTLAGAVARIWYQHDRPFLGDESGTLFYMRESAGYILSHYGTWLSMNYFILLEKGVASLFGTGAWTLTAVSLLAGIAAIPLTVQLALKFCAPRTALVAGALAAGNPFLINYSPVIRSYSLVVVFAIWSLLAFFRWHRWKGWGGGIHCATVLTLLCLLHLIGIYTWVLIGVLLLMELGKAARAGRAKVWLGESVTLTVPLAVGLLALVLAYSAIYPELKIINAQWTATPPTKVDYLPTVFRSFFIGGWPGLLTLLALGAGAWAATQEQRQLLLLWLAVFVPVFAMSWQGVAHLDWCYARFLIFCVPYLLVILAQGVAELSGLLKDKALPHALALFTLLLIASWLPNHLAALQQNKDFPWPRVETYLASLAPDVLVLAQPLDNIHLIRYSLDTGRAVQTVNELPSRKLDIDKAPSTKLVYVSSQAPLKTALKPWRSGKVRAYLYDSASFDTTLRALRADLMNTLGNKAGGDLFQHYAALAAINIYLGLPEENGRYQLLLQLSRQGDMMLQSYSRRVEPVAGTLPLPFH